jgi:alkanesulfonate monooxygenase SsuD/methylene tetrahydromethanopterin reductase-like flavin-dependent oxidoreductase (luciferase family)
LSYSGGFGGVGPDPVDDAARPLLVGSDEQVCRDLEALWELGFTNVVFRFGGNDTANEDVLRHIDYVAEKVLPFTRSLS